ncbi:bacterial Fmu (Sun)/eukaryotic nucleolar NOL1/Nop2p [Tanacetum coccineum]
MIRHPHPQLPCLHPNMLNSKKKVTSSVMETNLHLVNVWNLVKILMPRGCWSSFVDTHQPVSIKELDTYCIDEIASESAVVALNISPGDHVLDLCAAPELLGNSGSVTGVDVARHWLVACRTLIQKYSLGDHCRLFVAD